MHLIKNNRFRRIFADYCGILNVEHWSLALKDVRFHLVGNYYHEVFAAEAAILRVESKFTKVAAEQADYLNENPQQLGIVIMEDELVTQSQADGLESSLVYVSSESSLLTIIIRDSIFTENHLNIISTSQATVFMHGCIISDIEFEASNQTIESSDEMKQVSAASMVERNKLKELFRQTAKKGAEEAF